MNQSTRVLLVESKKVIIHDQSVGFNSENHLDFPSERAFDLHGCGIAISSYTVLRQLGQEPPYPLAFLDAPPVQPKGSEAP